MENQGRNGGGDRDDSSEDNEIEALLAGRRRTGQATVQQAQGQQDEGQRETGQQNGSPPEHPSAEQDEGNKRGPIILRLNLDQEDKEEEDPQPRPDDPRVLEIVKFEMTPKEVKEKLDRSVIGQSEAKKVLANAICYHYANIKRLHERKVAGKESDISRTVKRNVLMIGNTGVGKTYLVSKIADIVGVPFVVADATKITQTGYVGGDVDDVIRNLYYAAEGNIELAQYGIVYIDEVDKIRGSQGIGRDVGGAEVQRSLLKLIEDADIEIEKNQGGGGLFGRKKKKKSSRVINTKNILFIASGAFPGLEDSVKEREGESVNGYWHRHLKTDDLVEFGMEPEFVGRLPVRVGLHDLSEEDLFHILKDSDDSPMYQYLADFASYGIDAGFTDDALRTFARAAFEEKTGARALAGIIERTLTEFKYEMPSSQIGSLTVDENLVSRPREMLMDTVVGPHMERFSDAYFSEHGIRLRFEQEAYWQIAEKALNEDKKPSEVCEGILGMYAGPLKERGEKEFVVGAELVQDPEGYLKRMYPAKPEEKHEGGAGDEPKGTDDGV
jgi:endopeptidase Clp ATP-binding regulatory subunit ClpX